MSDSMNIDPEYSQEFDEDAMDIDFDNTMDVIPGSFRQIYPASTTSDAIMIISNNERVNGIPLTLMFPPDESANSGMTRFYHEYAQGLVLEDKARLAKRDQQAKNARKIVNDALKDINTLRKESEDKLFNDYSVEFNRLRGPTGVAIDFNKLEYDYKTNFFNPNVLYFMRGIVKSIIEPEKNSALVTSRKESLRRIRHWLQDLRVVAAGTFGKTLVSGILGVNQFLALKYPLNEQTDQRHEYLIGLRVNKIRELGLCANVVYTYGLFTCAGAKIAHGDEKGDVVCWCATDSAIKTQYIVMENIENTGTMSEFIVRERASLTPNLVTSLIAQWIFTEVQLENQGVTHWDRHLSNELRKPVPINSVARFMYDGSYTYIKTFGTLSVLFDFGLSSGPAENGYVGPDPAIQENTSCYFNGKPWPLADIYSVLTSFYYTIAVNLLANGSVAPNIRKLAAFLEDIICDYFKPVSRDWFVFRRENLINPNTPRDEKHRITREIRDLYFRRLSPESQKVTMSEFIVKFFSRDSYLQLYNPQWNDVVSMDDNITTNLEPLFCDTGMTTNPRKQFVGKPCETSFQILTKTVRSPQDYFEVDNYHIDANHLQKSIQNDIIDNTMRSIKLNIQEALTQRTNLISVTLPDIPARPDTVMLKKPNGSIRSHIEDYIDSILSWWYVEADIAHTNDILARLGTVPGEKSLLAVIQGYIDQRDTKLYNKICLIITEYKRKFDSAMLRWYGGTQESVLRNNLETTQRNLKLAMDTLAVSNFAVTSTSNGYALDFKNAKTVGASALSGVHTQSSNSNAQSSNSNAHSSNSNAETINTRLMRNRSITSPKEQSTLSRDIDAYYNEKDD